LNIYNKIIVLLVLTIVFSKPSHCFAQNKYPVSVDTIEKFDFPKHTFFKDIIKTNLLPAFWGPIPFSSEYRLITELHTGKKQSIQIGGSYLGKSLLLLLFEDSLQKQGIQKIIIRGYRFQCAYKFYLSAADYTYKRWYLAPYISYSSAKISDRQAQINFDYLQITHFNINILLGYQKIFNDFIVLDVFTGLGYKNNTWDDHKTKTNYSSINIDELGIYSSNFKFTLGFNIGIAF